jgi:SAM-dependent methyltransferase
VADTSPAAVTRQYATGANLAARQSIYRFRRGGRPGDIFERVLDLAGVVGDEVVADVGCGNGLYLRALGQRGHRGAYVGVDLSAGILRDALAYAPVVCGDAQALPLATGAADVALCPHMLYHVPDQAAAVAELRREFGYGDDVLAELRHRVEAVIERRGVFEVTTASGCFVCS